LLIRPATAADVPAIMDLANSAPSAAQWSAEQYHQIFTNPPPRRMVLVIEEQSALQAFLVGHVLNPEWEVENIVVANSSRRQGLGKQLLDEFVKVSRREGARTILLEVRESNSAARKLYEKCGFVESGRRQRYYKQPEEDAILYELFPG
jgi:ribosomal-protein-alanine N-acetyltransferase